MTSTAPQALAPSESAACCAPGSANRDHSGHEGLGEARLADAQRLARTFKALGDPTRLRLLAMIAAQDGGEACICDMTEPVGLSQPTVSHHMKQLVEAGLVTREQRGKWAYYALVPGALAALGTAILPEQLRAL